MHLQLASGRFSLCFQYEPHFVPYNSSQALYQGSKGPALPTESEEFAQCSFWMGSDRKFIIKFMRLELDEGLYQCTLSRKI